MMDRAEQKSLSAEALNLDPYWMPFTANRYFKRNPRIIVAGRGAYYRTAEGEELFDCLSGLWCCPLGHGHPKIVEALRNQAETLDYCPSFQLGNPLTFRLAERVANMAPAGLDHVFFANSGSESVDTALKIAIAYHRARGDAARTRLIGRERGYHGVGLGGISVGGMVSNRKTFASMMIPGVDHLRHTWDPAQMAFSRGQPAWGAELADDLQRLVALHDASTIAAVIVEPMQGSTGVLVPPVGYLDRLREICTKHGILLIFDEVITGFGRMGASFGADRFGVVPDMICFAKAVTNGVIPMGGVIASNQIHDAFMTGPERSVELFHGYTYSGHPMAAAAGHAALDIMQEEGLFERVRTLEPVLEGAIHALRDLPGVTDIRNIGLAAGIDLDPIAGQPGLRASQVFDHAIGEGLLCRFTGDTIAVAPPFISTLDELRHMAEGLGKAIRAAFR